ncbi:hypothetical protein [Pelagibacterium sp.]|uniref:hypothetical protein n=1 Tax=Pelagibacterium sp. TaxID=1967288 RepID=UPI003BAB3062
MKKSPILAGIAVMILTHPVGAQFAREGIPTVPNGIVSPFVGSWQVGFPQADGGIIGAPLVTCEEPVILADLTDNRLSHSTSSGQSVSFEVFEFSNRTTWFPEAGESSVAVWTSPDEFLLYRVDMVTGQAHWDDPRSYRRCERD